MVSTRGHSLVLVRVWILYSSPIHWIYGWGLAYGIYVWISTRVMGDLMGSFSQDDTRFQTAPFLCYILYIEQWKFR
jgi:hypothetical protein